MLSRMPGELPVQLTVGETEYEIRTDFRDMLKIVCAFDDPDLEDGEKVYICLYIMYPDFDTIPESDYEAAFKAALEFINAGMPESKAAQKKTMDWEQDAALLFPAVNKIAGYETRACEYLHWWTFIGYYMEISEGVFSHVLGLRAKKAKGKKLEKWEREYWDANKTICVLKPKLSTVEQEEKERLKALLG